MNKYTYLLFMLLLSVSTFAQRVDSVAAGDRPKTYVPGRWSVGLRYELIPFQPQYAANYAPVIVAGYNPLPRLSVQLGLTLTNLRRRGDMQTPLTVLLPPLEGYTGSLSYSDYRTGLYVPLILRYSLSKPFRRVQPYLTATLHGYLGGVQSTRYTYENGQQTNAPAETDQWRTNGLGTAAGFGLRIRTIDRFFLHGELGVGRTYQQNTAWEYSPDNSIIYRRGNTTFTALLGVGLTYEFR